MAPLSFDLHVPRQPQRPLPAVQPRHWQTQLIQLLQRRLQRPGGHDVLINAGPGAGKTLGALLGFERLQRQGHLQRFLVFCHRSSIASQWLQAAAGLQLRLREWQPGEDRAEPWGDADG